METGIDALTTINTIEVGYNVNFSADVLAFTYPTPTKTVVIKIVPSPSLVIAP